MFWIGVTERHSEILTGILRLGRSISVACFLDGPKITNVTGPNDCTGSDKVSNNVCVQSYLSSVAKMLSHPAVEKASFPVF